MNEKINVDNVNENSTYSAEKKRPGKQLQNEMYDGNVRYYLKMSRKVVANAMAKYNVNLSPFVWCFDTYPVLSIIGAMVAFAYAAPILVFVLFGIVTLLVTFAIFVVIEGILLGSGFLFLFSILSTLTIFMGVCLLLCWFVYISAVALKNVSSREGSVKHHREHRQNSMEE